MSVINIRKAKREGARIVLALAGISGGGKTFTALQIAYGLTGGDASKIGLLDTENRRGSLYADTIKNKDGQVQEFWIGDLDAPFSPQRYIDAIKQWQDMGIEVLVIDSVSHEYEGTGGIEEIATIDPTTGGERKVKAWNKAKLEHKRFMNALLQSDMHVIVCVRAREKVEVVKVNGKTEYRPLGVLPVQEKNFMFEMTASMMLWDSGRQRQVMKAPKELEAIFGECGQDFHAGYIGAKEGYALRNWIMGGGQVDQEIEKARNILRSHAELGLKGLQEAWNGLPESVRAKFGNKCPDDIKAAAKAFDDAKRTAASDINEAILSEENDNTANG